jgi:hypothetical protein
MNKIYDVKQLTVTQEHISFELSGNKIQVPLIQTGSKILPKTKPEYLQIFELDEDGIGMHWPVIDEDLSIEGLLRSVGREDLIIKDIPSIHVEDEESEEQSKFSVEQKTVYSS